MKDIYSKRNTDSDGCVCVYWKESLHSAFLDLGIKTNCKLILNCSHINSVRLIKGKCGGKTHISKRRRNPLKSISNVLSVASSSFKMHEKLPKVENKGNTREVEWETIPTTSLAYVWQTLDPLRTIDPLQNVLWVFAVVILHSTDIPAQNKESGAAIPPSYF